MIYAYKGVAVRQHPETGMISVRSRSGNYVTLTPDINRAVKAFIKCVKEKPMSEQDKR